MDFSPIIQQVYGALWYLIPLAILAGILKSPWFKGITGEFLVNTAARLFLAKDEYKKRFCYKSADIKPDHY